MPSRQEIHAANVASISLNPQRKGLTLHALSIVDGPRDSINRHLSLDLNAVDVAFIISEAVTVWGAENVHRVIKAVETRGRYSGKLPVAELEGNAE